MEILIIIAVLAVAAWFVFFREKPADKTGEAPYKVETPTFVHGGEPIATVVVEGAGVVEPVAAVPTAVNDQITDSVTQAAPAKKPRKPRTPKAATPAPAKEKAAKPKKAAAIKATPKTKPRSKKA